MAYIKQQVKITYCKQCGKENPDPRQDYCSKKCRRKFERKYCKECNCENPNTDQEFCSRTCSNKWQRRQKKVRNNARKKGQRRQERYEMSLGSDFSNEGEHQW